MMIVHPELIGLLQDCRRSIDEGLFTLDEISAFIKLYDFGPADWRDALERLAEELRNPPRHDAITPDGERVWLLSRIAARNSMTLEQLPVVMSYFLGPDVAYPVQ